MESNKEVSEEVKVKSLQECKDQVARKVGYANEDEMFKLLGDASIIQGRYSQLFYVLNQAAELYASQFKPSVEQPDKDRPDFDAMILKEQFSTTDCKGREIDVLFTDDVKMLMEHIWTTYVQPQKWIPVSERLPENKEWVLCGMYSDYKPHKFLQFVGCYTKGHEIEYEDDDYQGDYDEVEDRNGTLYLKPGWYELEETPGGNYDEQWLPRKVSFWMPLPSPPVSLQPDSKVEQK